MVRRVGAGGRVGVRRDPTRKSERAACRVYGHVWGGWEKRHDGDGCWRECEYCGTVEDTGRRTG